MSDRINLLKRTEQLNKSPDFDSFSKVVIHINDEEQITVGNDSGRTLEITNPFGTQAMAQAMLNKLRGYQYSPYEATGALLDPAAEMGDAVSVHNVYGGIYRRIRNFGRLMKADIAAPRDEEIDHEYHYESPQERKYKREFGETRATLRIQAGMIEAEVTRASQAEGNLSTRITQTATDITSEVTRAKDAESTLSSRITQNATEIAAKVSQTGGNNSSFGWSLKASEFGLYAGSKKVFYVNRNGAYVDGEIRATKGTIGGFTIGATALQYNGLEWNSTNKTTGAYIGQNGIQLGKAFKVTNQGAVTASNLTINGGAIKIGSNFRVDSSGNVTANNMTLTGTLKVGGQNITADALRQGAQSAYNNGSYWSGGSGYGYSYNNATKEVGGEYPEYFRARVLSANSANFAYLTIPYGRFTYGDFAVTARPIKDGDGNYVTVLTY